MYVPLCTALQMTAIKLLNTKVLFSFPGYYQSGNFPSEKPFKTCISTQTVPACKKIGTPMLMLFLINSSRMTNLIVRLSKVITCDQASLFFSRWEGTPDYYLTIRLPPPNWNICQRECRRSHLRIRMKLAQLPEVASWAGITQGMNSVNLHAVLYSTTNKNMVYFVKHVLLFRL